jgi:hypothetical protein
MLVECALAVSSRRLTAFSEAPATSGGPAHCVGTWRWQSFARWRSDRISPDQGCLEIAVMLKGSSRFRHLAAKARRDALAIVFFDRNVALICVFAIGAYKPV